MDYSNFHNHTNYADGASSCEEMILAAIERGYRAFGISEHSHTIVPFDEGNLFTIESQNAFFDEMRALQAKYADKIDVFYGIEHDILCGLPTDDAEYIVGSVHFVQPNGEFCFVDYGEDKQRETVAKHYNGDWYAFAEDYYAQVSQVASITKCNFVGHFDLVTKYNDSDRLFDTSHPRYRAAALTAMDEILKTCRVFEVNTGAMYRTGRAEQYPQTWLLSELLTRGGEVILSSDSHSAEGDWIGYKFAEMDALLREVGFKHRKTLTRDGFADVVL